MGGLSLLVTLPAPQADGWRMGVLDLPSALSGLSNEGMVTVAVLFVVASGLQETGAIHHLAQRLLGRPTGVRDAQIRIMVPSAILSAFMNNTPLVATVLPVVGDWAKKVRLPVSHLLIPLSFASILGGACTLVGTTSNLIVHGWLVEQLGPESGLAMFEIAWVGVPCALAGILYLVAASRHLLPPSPSSIRDLADPRQYTIEMMVDAGGPLVGRSVEEAGLRALPGSFLFEIQRVDYVLPAVGPRDRLRDGDRLVFAGVVDSIVDLQKIRGLTPATDQIFDLGAPRSDRSLVEAVVSDSCPLIGVTIREGDFRKRYNAAVIAVASRGRLIRKKIGDIRLRPGDTLLLEAGPSFIHRQRNSRDFYLVSEVEGSTPPRHDRAGLAIVILAAMVVAVAAGWASMLKAAVLAAGLMVLTGCTSIARARRAVDWQVLIVIAAAIGIGKAMQETGLAQSAATLLLDAAGPNPRVALGVVLVLTAVLANLVTAKAAAVLMLPIALAAAGSLGVEFAPFAIAVLIAAATAVATPISYPTNLMVYGPGGYRFADYLRIGVPLSLIVWVIAIYLIPLVWPLH